MGDQFACGCRHWLIALRSISLCPYGLTAVVLPRCSERSYRPTWQRANLNLGARDALYARSGRLLTDGAAGVLNGCVVAQPWGIRVQLKGPNEVAVVGLCAPAAAVSLSHSSGNVLPCTTTRWKLGTS